MSGNDTSPVEQFDRFLQKLHEQHAIKAVLTGDEGNVITLRDGVNHGPPITSVRLETLVRSLPPERIGAREVLGTSTNLFYSSAYGSWNLKVDRGHSKLRLEITPQQTALNGQSQIGETEVAAQSSDSAPALQPATSQVNHRRRPKLLIVASLIALVAFVATGVLWNQERVEENRLQAIRQQLKAIVLADNALALEVLDLDESSHITYAEFFKRAEKNREERDDLIRQIRAIEAGPYAEDVQNFIRLMELETEFVRCEEAVSRQSMEVSSRGEALIEFDTVSEQARKELTSARERYMATPYGEDYSEKISMDIAATKVEQSQNLGKEAVKLYDKAHSKMQTKMAAAAFAAENWIRVERQFYPWAFAPPRNITDKLIKKKSKYISDDPNVEVTKPKPAPVRGVKQVNVSVATSPSRVHSQQVLERERFPQTRMRILSTDDVVEMSKEDLRYAINEMYARYGMTFRDKSYQAHFDGLGWYRPDDKWTTSQIEKVFTDTERKNLGVLINERGYRQDGDEGN